MTQLVAPLTHRARSCHGIAERRTPAPRALRRASSRAGRRGTTPGSRRCRSCVRRTCGCACESVGRSWGEHRAGTAPRAGLQVTFVCKFTITSPKSCSVAVPTLGFVTALPRHNGSARLPTSGCSRSSASWCRGVRGGGPAAGSVSPARSNRSSSSCSRGAIRNSLAHSAVPRRHPTTPSWGLPGFRWAAVEHRVRADGGRRALRQGRRALIDGRGARSPCDDDRARSDRLFALGERLGWSVDALCSR